MQQLFAAALLFGLTATIASARLGETEAQISARYGKSIGDIPTEAFGPVRGYMMPGFLVGVKLVDGLSVMEMISKNDQSEMSGLEIEKFLKSHGAEGPWNAEKWDRPGWKRWRTADEALVAVYDAKRHFLYINSRKFYEDQDRKLEKEEREKPASSDKPL